MSAVSVRTSIESCLPEDSGSCSYSLDRSVISVIEELRHLHCVVTSSTSVTQKLLETKIKILIFFCNFIYKNKNAETRGGLVLFVFSCHKNLH
jgi:hypothetical protein